MWRVAAETGLRAVALRPCVIYGEGDRHFSPRVAAALRLGRGIAPLLGRGDNLLSVVYAGNVAAAVLAALDRDDADRPVPRRQRRRDHPAGVPRALRRGARRHAALRAGAGGGGVAAPHGRWTPRSACVRPRAPMGTLKTAVQFLANDNPYSSARAERELAWRPPVPPPAAAERTGRAFRRDPHPTA